MGFPSVKTASAAWPASRWPLPVSFVPPKGRCTSAPIVPALMYVIPACKSRIERNALLTSRVTDDAESLCDCTREDRRREPVLDPVRDADRLVEVADADQRGRGTEDLLLGDTHL